MEWEKKVAVYTKKTQSGVVVSEKNVKDSQDQKWNYILGENYQKNPNQIIRVIFALDNDLCSF